MKAILERLFEKRFYEEYDFIKKTYDVLKNFGFTDDNAKASVYVCRDEISKTIRSRIKRVGGKTFNFFSLADLFTAGKTGMKVFISHASKVKGKERYVFYAFSHVGIHENEKFVDAQKADYAVFSGIQVHVPEENYIVPNESYVVVNDERKNEI